MFHFYFLQYCSTAAVWNWMLMEIVEKRWCFFPLLNQMREGGSTLFVCPNSNIWIWQNMVKYTFTWSVFCLIWQFMHDIRVICGQPIIIHIGWQFASKMAEEYTWGCERVSGEGIFNAWLHFWPKANQPLGKNLNLVFSGNQNKTLDSNSLRSLLWNSPVFCFSSSVSGESSLSRSCFSLLQSAAWQAPLPSLTPCLSPKSFPLPAAARKLLLDQHSNCHPALPRRPQLSFRI